VIILVYEEDELEKQKRRVEEELDRRRKETEECKSGTEKHSVQNEFVEVQSA